MRCRCLSRVAAAVCLWQRSEKRGALADTDGERTPSEPGHPAAMRHSTTSGTARHGAAALGGWGWSLATDDPLTSSDYAPLRADSSRSPPSRASSPALFKRFCRGVGTGQKGVRTAHMTAPLILPVANFRARDDPQPAFRAARIQLEPLHLWRRRLG